MIDTIRTRASTATINGAIWLAAAMTVQAGLGIITLLHQVPIPLGIAHQAVAIVVLTLALFQAERLGANRRQSHDERLGMALGHAGT